MSKSFRKIVPTIGAVAFVASFSAHAGTYSDGSIGSILWPPTYMQYHVYTPTGYVSGTPTPAIVALHGCGQSAKDFAKLARLTAKADANGFILILPRQSAARNPTGCWNHQGAYQRGQGEAKMIDDVLVKVRQSRTIDASRTYILGLSAGGSMAANMLGCYADKYAAGAIMAGTMYKSATSQLQLAGVALSGSSYNPDTNGREAWQCSGSVLGRKTPVIYFHGDADMMLNNVNAEQGMRQWLQTNDYADDGLDNNSIPYSATQIQNLVAPGGRQYTRTSYFYGGEMKAEKILVNGAGHVWGGGDPAVSGADTSGPSYTDIGWDFLRTKVR